MSQARASEIMSIYLNDVVGQGAVDLIPDFTGESFVDHTQPGLQGPAALTAHVEAFRGNIPDLRVEVVAISADDHSAFGIWRWSGTPTTPVWGSTPSGDVFVPSLIGSYFRFENNMLVEYQPFIDAMNVISQLS